MRKCTSAGQLSGHTRALGRLCVLAHTGAGGILCQCANYGAMGEPGGVQNTLLWWVGGVIFLKRKVMVSIVDFSISNSKERLVGG